MGMFLIIISVGGEKKCLCHSKTGSSPITPFAVHEYLMSEQSGAGRTCEIIPTVLSTAVTQLKK